MLRIWWRDKSGSLWVHEELWHSVYWSHYDGKVELPEDQGEIFSILETLWAIREGLA